MYLMFELLERLGNFCLGLKYNGLLICSLRINGYVLLNIFGIFLFCLGILLLYIMGLGLFIIIKVLCILISYIARLFLDVYLILINKYTSKNLLHNTYVFRNKLYIE